MLSSKEGKTGMRDRLLYRLRRRLSAAQNRAEPIQSATQSQER